MKTRPALQVFLPLVACGVIGCATNREPVAIAKAPVSPPQVESSRFDVSLFRSRPLRVDVTDSLPAGVRTASLYRDRGDSWAPINDTAGAWENFYGIPVARVDEDDDVFLRYPRYVVSYDPDGLFPVFTAHVITRGSVEKGNGEDYPRPDWEPDRRLEVYMRHVPNDTDFTDLDGLTDTNSPYYYERGHMTAKEQMEGWGRQASDETFYLSNAVPQIKALNSGAWRKLEAHCRHLALARGKVLEISGPYFKRPGIPMRWLSGDGRDLPRADGFWKMVVFEMDDGLHAAAFVFPHKRGNSARIYAAHQKTIADVEDLSGLTFFSRYPELPEDFKTSVDPTMQSEVESVRSSSPALFATTLEPSSE